MGAHASVQHHDHPLAPLEAFALIGGIALFCLADVAYRWRDHHQLTLDRLIAGAAVLLVLPAGTHMPALATLVILTAIGVLRLAWELWQRPRVGPVRAGEVR